MTRFIRLFDTARVYTLQFAVTRTSVHTHVFTSRCLVGASNGGRSPSSGFQNCPRASATSQYSLLCLAKSILYFRASMLDNNTVNKRTSLPRTNSCTRQPHAIDTHHNSNSPQRPNPSSPLANALSHSLQQLTGPAYSISARTACKTPFLCCSSTLALEICLFAEPLPSNDCCIVAYFAIVT
jgi:hypothetical protein